MYEQLAGILRARISSGELSGRIPSIKHLAQEYGVSHRTVEKALDLLKQEGAVVAILGRGYFTAPLGAELEKI